MRALPVIIGIVIILSLVCSPALAISKADLIASYIVKPMVTPDTPDVHRFSDSDSIGGCNDFTSGMNYSSVFADDQSWVPPEPVPDASIHGGFPPSWMRPGMWYVKPTPTPEPPHEHPLPYGVTFPLFFF